MDRNPTPNTRSSNPAHINDDRGMAGQRFTTPREYKVREDQNLLSRTDKNGIITYAAQSFVEVSGYSREELIGAPHSIVRHPEMPKEAFANLWQTISRGEVWVGMVKNLRKNGDYYWVRAHATPIIENGEVQGYTSVRVKPSDEEIRQAEEAYARIRNGQGGITLDRGAIVHTGAVGLIKRLHLQSLRARVYLAVLFNFALLLTGIGMVEWRKAALQEEFGAIAQAESGSGKVLGLVQEALNVQNSFDYMQIGILLLIALVSFGAFELTVRAVRREIGQATRFTMQVAAGNLAASRPKASNREFARLVEILAVMQRSLGNIVIEVNGCLQQVRPAATQVAAGSEDLASRTEQQASSLQQTAASMEEITSTVEQNADNARQASQLANSAALEVRNSGDAMHQVVERMTAITDSSRRIAEIISVIDSIAFQTNILALNASVEAARAGEHGRGFAVVANEVRSLATRSASAAEEVRKLIEESRREVSLGEQQVQQAERAIEGVIEAVLKVNDIMGEISSASDEQNRGLEQVNIAVAQMDEVTQRNAGMVVESARAANIMATQVSELANSIAVLRLAGEGPERVRPVETRAAVHPAPRTAPSERPVTPVRSRPQAKRSAALAEADDHWTSF